MKTTIMVVCLMACGDTGPTTNTRTEPQDTRPTLQKAVPATVPASTGEPKQRMPRHATKLIYTQGEQK